MQQDTHTIDRLFLELAQFTTAKTPRELALEDLLRSARAIAQREGKDTAWKRFDDAIWLAGVSDITAKVFKVLPSDFEE